MKLLQLSKPHLLVMVGIAGAGKTFFAEKFAHTFQVPLVSDEKFIRQFSDARLNEAQAGELLKELTASTFEELFKTERTIIADIQSDARTERTAIATNAKKHGYETLFIWVQTDPNAAKERSIKPGKQSTNRQFDAREYDRFIKHFTAPNQTEHTVVISGKHTYASQAKMVLKKVSAPRVEITKRHIIPTRTTKQEPSSRRNITIR